MKIFSQNTTRKAAALLLGIAMLLSINSVAQLSLTVTRTDDFDPFLYTINPQDPKVVGTLQWAVRTANDVVGASNINFAIPGQGKQTIELDYYLPTLSSNITISGKTQPDYAEMKPSIAIDGKGRIKSCFTISNQNNITIEGLEICNFMGIGIQISTSESTPANITIKDNVINQIENFYTKDQQLSFAGSGIMIEKGNGISILGNIIGTDVSGNANMYSAMYGINCSGNAYNITIGGSNPGEANTIAYAQSTGVKLFAGSNIRISGNIITNCPQGIFSTKNTPEPVINQYATTGAISGTAMPGSTVELFGSSQNEYANQYLKTTIANAQGFWSETLESNSYSNAIATATGGSTNVTSGFSPSVPLGYEPGVSCGTAIEINPVSNVAMQSYNINTTEKWFKFTATDLNVRIFFDNFSHLTNIAYIYMYKGDCDHTEMLTYGVLVEDMHSETNFDAYNLTVGDVYSIKVVRVNTEAASFNMGVQNVVVTSTSAGCAPNSWMQVGVGFNSSVFALLKVGDDLYAGGEFTSLGDGISANFLAKWNGTAWSSVNIGLDGPVYALFEYSNKLYIGGKFTSAGGLTNVNNIIAMDLTTNVCTMLGNGITGNSDCRILAINENHGEIFVGGQFLLPFNFVAKWNIQNATWSATGPVINGAINSFAKDNNNVLFAGGCFSEINLVQVHNVAKYDYIQNKWVAVGIPPISSCVETVTFHNNQLIAAGSDHQIVKWNPVTNTWSYITNVGGLSYFAESSISFDNKYYVGGQFSTINGITVNSIAKWNGSTWSAVGNGLSVGVNCFATYPNTFLQDELYVGGIFTLSGSEQTKRIAKLCSCNLNVTISQQNTMCGGTATGIATATVVSGSGIEPFSYNWSNGATTQTATGLAAGTYRVTTTDAAGCTRINQTTIVNSTPSPIATALPISSSICSGAACSIALSSDIVGTTFNWTVTQTNTNGGMSGSNLNSINQTLTNNSNSNGTASYTITPYSNGCVGNSIETVITVKPKPIITATPASQSICSGSTAHITLTSSQPNTTFNWTVTDNLGIIGASSGSGNSINQTLTNIGDATYTATYQVTSIAGTCPGEPITAVINVKPKAIIYATPSPQSICSGYHTGISLSSNLPGLTFSWTTTQNGVTGASSGTGNNINQTLTNNGSTGTAIYNISTTYECKGKIPQVTVHVENQPDFLFNRFDNCEDSPTPFTTAFVSNSPNIWSFGDGLSNVSSSSTSLSHSFALPGYYNVTLNSSACPTGISKIIEIMPKVSINSLNCCPGGPFNEYNDVTISTTYTVPASKSFKGIIHIQSPCSLIVNSGITLSFGPQGGIIVEPGATLYLNGGILTGTQALLVEDAKWTACNVSMWKGVEVWGNISNPSISAQGKIVMRNNAQILYAHNAVILGKTKLIPEGNSFRPDGHDTQYSGGIIDADGASFKINAVAVRFWEYSFVNHSSIKNCIFLGNTLFNRYYNSGNQNYSMPDLKAHNPFYAEANNQCRSAIGIIMTGIRGVTFENNNFTDMETGMESHNSQHNVKKGVYKNLTFGISILNQSSGILAGHSITECNFSDIPGNYATNPASSSAAILIAGGYNDYIKGNTFGADNEFDLQTQNNVGIYLLGSSKFKINDNVFYRNSCGIYSVNSNLDYSKIGYEISGNTFTRTSSNIITNGNNTSLSIKCNNSDNPTLEDFSGTNWAINGNLAPQGEPLSGILFSEYTKKPAGNKFEPELRKQISNVYNMVTNPTPHYFNYYYHTSPLERRPVITQNSAITLIPDNVPFDAALSCVTTLYPPVQLQDFINNSDNEIANLQTEFNTALTRVDDNRTQELLAAVESDMPEGQLKNLLADIQLSDTVLLSVIKRPAALSPGIFKQVLIPNSPVSDKVRQTLDIKLETMPLGIAAQIQEAQWNNSDYRTLTAIGNDLERIGFNKLLYVAQLQDTLLKLGDTTAVYNLLAQQNTNNAKRTLTASYLTENKLTLATASLSTFIPQNQEESDWKNVSQLLLNFANAGHDIYAIDSVETLMLREIAGRYPPTQASANALTILRIAHREPITFQLPETGMVNRAAQKYYNSIELPKPALKSNSYVNIFPNPAKDRVVVNFNPEYNNGIIEITDILGNMINSYDITGKCGNLIIDIANYTSGIYLVKLCFNGKVMKAERLNVIK